ncbi:MAG: hypothetical protein S4CHLAM102_14660 [Chlamydiia bacterium]|nr:hypothetical protein [Chlamydiia bacterium]
MTKFFQAIYQWFTKVIQCLFGGGGKRAPHLGSGDGDECAADGQRAKIVSVGGEILSAYLDVVVVGTSTYALNEAGDLVNGAGQGLLTAWGTASDCLWNDLDDVCGARGTHSITLVEYWQMVSSYFNTASGGMVGEAKDVKYGNLSYSNAVNNLKTAFGKLSAFQLTQSCIAQIVDDITLSNNIWDYYDVLVPQLFQKELPSFMEISSYFGYIIQLITLTSDYMSDDQFNMSQAIGNAEQNIFNSLSETDSPHALLTAGRIDVYMDPIHNLMGNLTQSQGEWLSNCQNASYNCPKGGSIVDAVKGLSGGLQSASTTISQIDAMANMSSDFYQDISNCVAVIGQQFDKAHAAKYVNDDQHTSLANAVTAFNTAYSSVQSSQTPDNLTALYHSLSSVLTNAQPIKKKN